MEDTNEKKGDFTPAEMTPYEKPQLHNYGKLEDIASAYGMPPGKVVGAIDAHSGMGHGRA